MSEPVMLAATARERFMQQARDEMAAFERLEAELRRQERQDRATQLRALIGAQELSALQA
jgi:hypothetical protein